MHRHSPAARRAACRLILFAALAAGVGCSRQTVEERARDTADKIMKSMVDVEGIALEQKVDPSVVSDVQKQLTAINEYQGEINGKLDSVTINALQSFQRTAGLKDDGLITPATRQKLAAAAAQPAS